MPEDSRRRPSHRQRTLSTLILLAGGFAGGGLLTLAHVPAGALIGSVLGTMSVNKLSETVSRRRPAGLMSHHVPDLPAFVRGVGQVLLGVLAGTRLDQETLIILLYSLAPVIVSVAILLLLDLALARYLVMRHGVDPLTAVMAAAPGGISALAIIAQRQGAAMHVVLAIHLFRVLLVVMLVLPILLSILRALQ